jgi:hypothetical protein
LPEQKVKALIKKNRDKTAIGALCNARNAFLSGDFKTSRIQVHQALSASKSPRVLAYFCKLLATSVIRKLICKRSKTLLDRRPSSDSR